MERSGRVGDVHAQDASQLLRDPIVVGQARELPQVPVGARREHDSGRAGDEVDRGCAERQGVPDRREDVSRGILLFVGFGFRLRLVLWECRHQLWERGPALVAPRDRGSLGFGGRQRLGRERRLDRRLDLASRGNRELDGTPRSARSSSEWIALVGVRDHDEDRAFREVRDGKSRVAAGEVDGEQSCRGRVDVVPGQVDERQLVLLGERAADLRFAQDPRATRISPSRLVLESRCWASAASSSSSVTSPSRMRSEPRTGRRSLSATSKAVRTSGRPERRSREDRDPEPSVASSAASLA